MKALERLKQVWSHAMPFAKFSDVIKRAVKEAIENNDPLKVIERKESLAIMKTGTKKAKPVNTPAPGFTNAAISRAVWKRDQARCTFIDPRTGELCNEEHFIEEDHIVPKAMGGDYSQGNIRLRCRAHNQRHAIDCFGMKKMKEHLRPIRH